MNDYDNNKVLNVLMDSGINSVKDWLRPNKKSQRLKEKPE